MNKDKRHTRTTAEKKCNEKWSKCIEDCLKNRKPSLRQQTVVSVSPRVPSARKTTQKRSRVERDEYVRNEGSISPMRGDTPESPDVKRSVPAGQYGFM